MAYSKKSRIFVNSLPKSGTFLLSSAIELFGYRDYYDTAEQLGTLGCFNYREARDALTEMGKAPLGTIDGAVSVGSQTPLYVGTDIFRKWLSVVPDEFYIAGHVSYSPSLPPILAELDYRHVFIIRDPQAVLPSLLSFVMNTRGLPKKHYLEKDFKLMTQSQRLEIILEGGYAPEAGVEIKSFAEIYRSMLAWRNDSDSLVVRFEDLVGKKGGGRTEQQSKVLKDIAAYLRFPAHDVLSNIEKIYNPDAPTFRIGQIDSWKNSMDKKMIDRIVAYCEPLCSEAGYNC